MKRGEIRYAGEGAVVGVGSFLVWDFKQAPDWSIPWDDQLLEAVRDMLRDRERLVQVQE